MEAKGGEGEGGGSDWALPLFSGGDSKCTLSLSLSSGSLCLALHLTGSLRNSSRISLDRSPSLILSSGLVFFFLHPFQEG